MSVVAHSFPAREAEVQRLRVLYKLLAGLTQAGGLDDVYSAALTALLDATTADRAAILLFDEDGVIRFKAAHGLSSEYQAAVAGHSPWKPGTRGAISFAVPDVFVDKDLASYRTTFEREGIRAVAFIPLALEGGVFGKFMLYYREPYECPPDELEIAQAIAAHVAVVTGRKRAELARFQTEQQLQAILDNSDSIIFIKDLQGRYQLVNKRYQELFHLSGTPILGSTDHDMFPPEIADRFQANDRLVLAAGKPLAIDEYAPHEDGVHTYVTMKFPIYGPDGSISAICGIATDITDRKEFELANERLAAIVENSDDAIISKNLNGIITSWNQAAERMFGYAADEIVGKPIATLAAPDRLNEMPEILEKLRRGERVDHYETRRRRKDGEIIDVALTVSPIRDPSGQIVGASKIARDITERKQAEKERAVLLAREQEARRTAELLNRIGLLLTAQLDLEKLVHEVTDITTAIVGAEFGVFLPNRTGDTTEADMFYSLSGAAREIFDRVDLSSPPFARTFRGGEVVRYDDVTKESGDPAFSPPHDRPVAVRSYLAAPVIARSGEVLGGLFFGHSVPGRFTHSHEVALMGIAPQAAIAMENARLFKQSQWIQAELKRSNEDLRRANRDLEVFAYSASHDLQEPLRTIGISAELIERSLNSKLQGEEAKFLTNIVHGARRMSALIEDLLAYTKATKYEEGPAPVVDSARVLGDVLESLRGAIEEAGATVTTGTLLPVAIHEKRLAQVLQNLMSNAIKYRNLKEVPRVHVTAEDRNGWCIFSVTDNGIGIDSQFADKIFGLFKRLHGREEYPGSGIGLAICQRVVEQYGGRIWLEQSVLGRGSTFCFALPARTGEQHAAQTES